MKYSTLDPTKRSMMLYLLPFQRTFNFFSKSCISFSIPAKNSHRYYMTNYCKLGTSSLSFKFMENLKNNSIEEAHRIFEKIPSPNVYQYTMMITSYSQMNKIDEALSLFYEMPVKDIVCWNSMIKGCLDCGNLEMGLKLFDEMPERNVVSWTTIVNGCAQFGKIKMAEKLFDKMPWKDTAAWNSMVFGYCCNGRIEDACKLFEKMPYRNAISWTTMIGGLDQCGRSNEALLLFQNMWVLGVKPTSSTYSCVLTACANISALICGVQLHAHLVKLGYAFDAFVSTTLITFYANCMQIENSSKVFNEILHGNVVTWTALLTGYGLNGKHEDVFRVFRAMINAGIMPNQSTFTSALNSCCELHALDKGKVLHTQTIKLSLDLDVFVGNSLIVMYTRSGCMDDGIASFNNIRKRNVVSWNSIIVGCAHNGHGTLSLELFDQMKCARVPPDEITYVGVLTACSYSRMLEKGRRMFELLIRDPSVNVNLEHCVCMVDLLGRSGKLEEAEKFIMNMPVKPNVAVWMALLSACRVHSNLEVAKRAAQHVLDLDPHNSAGYVLLSNLYASAGWWNEVSTLRQLMEDRGFVKQPGSSWVTGEG